MPTKSEPFFKVMNIFGRWAWIVVCFITFVTWTICLLLVKLLGAFVAANLNSRSGEDADYGGTDYYTGEYDLVRNPEKLYDEDS